MHAQTHVGVLRPKEQKEAADTVFHRLLEHTCLCHVDGSILITSARWETWIPLKRQDGQMTELTVFSYRTLKVRDGKGARQKKKEKKNAQLAKSCSGG